MIPKYPRPALGLSPFLGWAFLRQFLSDPGTYSRSGDVDGDRVCTEDS